MLPFADSASISGLCRAHSSNDSFARIQTTICSRPYTNLRQARVLSLSLYLYVFLYHTGARHTYRWKCLISGDVQNARDYYSRSRFRCRHNR